MSVLGTEVMPARLELAPLIIAAIAPAAERCGYFVALFGSTLRHGEGRDFDLIFVPVREKPASAEAVRVSLGSVGVIVHSFTRASHAVGIVGTLNGYAVDITVKESW